ncbi:carbohydrate ABC transporter permease [Helcococcus kunzii]|uniref:carbohydrate ABC transporter permease n=1 Tax=Helcococcus kunzii TaxID=40091 RepID=UPI0021A9501B|nr:ABC transporter permease subunit [Helcococcus kunzii]MCT1795672.1 ABC transporter permease subunit [Helcococcus kunzii]MCT1988633.1 ABC transporter permease subunit [Helcococcus kunzii]
MDYSKDIMDSVGRSYPRKNEYILDLIKATPFEQKNLKSNRNSHPYNIKLKEYKDKEKVFLEKIEKEASSRFKDMKDKKIASLEERVYKAKRKEEFYKKYIDLTYDAQLNYQIAERELLHIPDIIENDKQLYINLENRQKKLSNVTEADIEAQNKEIESKTKQRKSQLDLELKELQNKFNDGLISKSALRNEIKMKKRSAKDDIAALKYINQKKALEEDITNIKHHIRVDYQSKMNVLNSDISDIRRKTPIEVEKKQPIISYLTLLIPGLGQLLNKQYIKAALFFLGTLFIYLIAIPYALGFGNYQGEGVSGLLSLAEGGKRLDKSIIFMIEGIISIFLLLISMFLLYISFKDVNTVEKKMIKGTRKNEWFETKQLIATEGFPYLVISPAAIVIMFIVLVPIFTTILISFTNYNPDHQSKFTWAGFSNYQLLLQGSGVAGKAFWPIVTWTVIWTLAATSLAIFLGFVLALIANQDRIKFKGFFRTIYLLPWAVPAFITIMFFSLMFSRNGPLTLFINSLTGLSLDIKNNTAQTRTILILLQGWLGSAYIFLLTTGILQGIPKDLYEAAEIDGATGFKKTLRITIPLVLFQISPLIIGQYTFNFNNFSIIHLFNGGGPFNPSIYGNVAGSTDLLISYIYKLTINSRYQALGAAVTLIVSLILMFLSWLGFRNMKAFKED